VSVMGGNRAFPETFSVSRWSLRVQSLREVAGG
jgi:hypothetical protein